MIGVARGVGVGAEGETELAAIIKQITCRISPGAQAKTNVNAAVLEAM